MSLLQFVYLFGQRQIKSESKGDPIQNCDVSGSKKNKGAYEEEDDLKRLNCIIIVKTTVVI